jgi:hypothetical protein
MLGVGGGDDGWEIYLEVEGETKYILNTNANDSSNLHL